MSVFMSRKNVVPEVGPQVNFVEYIESSGTQYIDMGFKPTTSSRAEIDFQFTKSSGLKYAFGVADILEDLYWEVFHNGTTLYTTGFSASQTSDVLARTQYEGTCPSSFTDSVILFGENENGDIIGLCQGKLYSCKLYEGDTLVHDYRPCTNPDGIACLYDLVNEEYIYNAGTGNFVAGGAV